MASAAALSARTDGSAVLYTSAMSLSGPVVDVIGDHPPADVVVVGGESAVSAGVFGALERSSGGADVSRVAGATRVETAAAVARRILGGVVAARAEGGVTLVVANGWSSPDVGVAAALSARTANSAVAYTAADGLPAATGALLGEYMPSRVVIVGGTAAVSSQVEAAIRAGAPGAVLQRLTGETRVDTAVQAARLSLGSPDERSDGRTVIVASGWSPPDIGVAAALSARTANAAVVYTQGSRLPAAVVSLLESYEPPRVVIIGGTTAVGSQVEAAIRAAVPDATVPRYSGATRAATAAEVARRIFSSP